MAVDISALVRIDDLPCGAFVCDRTGAILAHNAGLAALLKYPPAALAARRYADLLPPGSASARLPAPGASVHQPYLCADGRVVPLVQSVAALEGGRTAVIVVPAAPRPEAVPGMQPGTLHEQDTGLTTSWLAQERLEAKLRARTQPWRGLQVYVIMVAERGRLRRNVGMAAWPAAMTQVAARLRRIAAEHHLVARLGTGEFLLASCDADLPSPERVLATLRTVMTLGEDEIRPSIALGVYLADSAGVDAAQAIQCASLAASAAQAAGGDRVHLFSRRLQAYANDAWQMRRDLAQAMLNERLHLVYQPEVCLSDMSLIAVETLVRWRCPRRGMVSPAVFIPVAEEAGLIPQLGLWVLREACRFGRALCNQYVDAPMIAVNVSPLQLRQPDFAAQVARTLEQTGLAPERLELEITEGVLLDQGEDTIAGLRAVHALGVRIALDDFGTGYSSLSYLSRLPIQRVKIDRAFVSGLPADQASLAIASAILGMARGLGLQVTAEGIETPAQAESLRTLGCHLGQGFGIMRPMAPESVRALLTPRL